MTPLNIETIMLKNWIAVISVMAIGPMLTGCYGRAITEMLTDTDIHVRANSAETKGQSGTAVSNSFRPLNFPVSFRFYDRNGDNYVSKKELKAITGDAENLDSAFRATDLNGDKWVSEAEYKKVPWGYDRRRDIVVHDV